VGITGGARNAPNYPIKPFAKLQLHSSDEDIADLYSKVKEYFKV
jgi:hypothetical protein